MKVAILDDYQNVALKLVGGAAAGGDQRVQRPRRRYRGSG